MNRKMVAVLTGTIALSAMTAGTAMAEEDIMIGYSLKTVQEERWQRELD